MVENMAAIESCRQEYHLNKCGPDTMVQALKEFCKQKEICMYSNPYSNIERTTLAFQLLSNMIKTFSEPLGIKELLFCLILLVIALFFVLVKFK